MNIDAWVYDADIHCNDCKESCFGDNDYAVDSEDNVITPIFSIDEMDINQRCGTCLEYIRDYPQCDTCNKRIYYGLTCDDCYAKETYND